MSNAGSKAAELEVVHLKIHVEIWLAAVNLHLEGHRAFRSHDLIQKVDDLFGDRRPGVMTHATAHCVANSPKNAASLHNYLTRLDRGLYRLHLPGDPVDHSRVGLGIWPDQDDVPSEYQSVWSEIVSRMVQVMKGRA